MKSNILSLIIIIIIGPASIPLNAQSDILGSQDPPGIRWKKIDTPHFEIVFPEELTQEGQRLANTLERLSSILSRTLNREPERITVLLSNQGVVANGYVALAPRRAEFFNVPAGPYTTGVSDWLHLLAVHEGRHIVQFDKMNQGFTRWAHIFSGEVGRALCSLLSAPFWFLEGDAVGMETALTQGGRGRLPDFDMDIRALLLSGIRYSYSKAYLRSFKDWYPTWYSLGYLLTTYAKRTYGPELWSRVLDRASSHSYSPFAFSSALKDEIGQDVVRLYEEAMDELEALWKKQIEGLTFNSFQILSLLPRKVWTNYMFPRYDRGGAVYAQKIGLAHPLTLVRLRPDGGEERILQFSPLEGFYNRLSLENGKAVWNEIIPDPRWGKRSYSDLVLHDLRSGKTKRITRKSRLFDPSLSPDGTRAAAVEFTPASRCALVILEAETGRVIKRLSNPQNDLIFFPTWSEDGERLVFARQNTQGRGMSLWDMKAEEMQDILPWSWENIAYPVFFNKYILYNSPCSGIDNIYALDIETRQRYQVTSSPFGAFFGDVSPDGQKLLYSNYTVQGYDVVEMPLDPSSWRRIEEVEDRNLYYFQPLIAQEQGGGVCGPGDIPLLEHEVVDYHPTSHLLNVHSWVPWATLTDAGIDFISQDKMNLALLTGGPRYNRNEKTVGLGLRGSYAGFFPVLEWGASSGGRTQTTTDENEEKITCSWRENSATLGLRLPLDLSRGIYDASLTLSSEASFVGISHQEYKKPGAQGNGRLLPVSYRLSFKRLRQSSWRDLNPTGGGYFLLAFRHTPWRGDYRGSLFSASLGLFFPGLFKHHSLHIQGGYEKQAPANYHFPSEMLFPRGYDYAYHETVAKVSVDYALPLAYPDLALGSILYLKRLKTNLFVDLGLGQDANHQTRYPSLGIDWRADLNMFDIPLDLDMGLRLVHRLKDSKFRVEFLFLGLSL